MRRRTSNPVAGAIAFIMISVGMLALFGIFGAFRANTYFNGEVTTAHITNCETHLVHTKHGSHEETTCYGEWTTADGQRHSGEIDDAGESDRGTDIAIRTTGDDAIIDSQFELWPLPVAGLALILTAVSIGVLRHTLRSQAARQAGYAPPVPYAPPGGHPYPPQPHPPRPYPPRYRPPGQ